MKKNFCHKRNIALLIIALIFPAISLLSAQPETGASDINHCLTCHREIEMLPEHFDPDDVHMQEGLSCAGCHGGDASQEDMEQAMSPAAGFVGIPSRSETPAFCGKCHSSIEFMRTYRPRIATDQVEQYYTSVHGQKLRKGDEKVAECVSCHTAHAIFPAKDGRSTVHPLKVPNTCRHCHADKEYMREYNIPTDQYEKFAGSVHGIALLEREDTGAPACNDCHGNHGATPPGIESVSHVCGTCHVNNMEYFASSPMAEPFSELEYHACEQCHGNHGVSKTSDSMVGTGENSVCLKCHSEGDTGYQMAAAIHDSLAALLEVYGRAQEKLKEVEKKGMDDVDIMFQLQEANQDLIHSRTLVHTFQAELVGERTSSGIVKSEEALQLAAAEIRDYHTRRRGFGIASIFIAILAVALFFKIRDMEKKKIPGNE